MLFICGVIFVAHHQDMSTLCARLPWPYSSRTSYYMMCICMAAHRLTSGA
jgi:hypothetical protein